MWVTVKIGVLCGEDSRKLLLGHFDVITLLVFWTNFYLLGEWRVRKIKLFIFYLHLFLLWCFFFVYVDRSHHLHSFLRDFVLFLLTGSTEPHQLRLVWPSQELSPLGPLRTCTPDAACPTVETSQPPCLSGWVARVIVSSQSCIFINNLVSVPPSLPPAGLISVNCFLWSRQMPDCFLRVS